MTKKMTVEEYRRHLRGFTAPERHPAKTKDAARKKIAMVVFLKFLKEHDIAFGGRWSGQKDSGPTLYLEYPPFKDRRFRFDMAIPAWKVMIDIQGGRYVLRTSKSGNILIGGAHHTPEGRRRDIEKNNLATIQGLRVLECEWSDVEDGQLAEWLLQLIQSSGLDKARELE